MSKHTPGPWYFDEGATIHAESRSELAFIADIAGYPDEEEQANAHLIAAAPELLEAAKSALARYPELNTLRAAIEKAEGKQ